jgi:hypothetical protein
VSGGRIPSIIDPQPALDVEEPNGEIKAMPKCYRDCLRTIFELWRQDIRQTQRAQVLLVSVSAHSGSLRGGNTTIDSMRGCFVPTLEAPPHLFFELQTPPACRTSIPPKVNPPTTRVRTTKATPLPCPEAGPSFSSVLVEARGRAVNHGDRSRRADRFLAVGDRSLWHSRYVGPQFESFSHHIF